MRVVRLTLLACIAAAAFPAGASAVRCAPPGNSGIDQYFETIPGASCNQAPPGSVGTGGSGGTHLSRGQSRQLAALGPAGRAVAQFVAATAPAIEGTGPSPAGGSPAAGSARLVLIAAAPPAAAGQPPVIGLLRPIVSGSAPGGVGIVLPIVLAAVLLLAVVTVLRRYLIRR